MHRKAYRTAVEKQISQMPEMKRNQIPLRIISKRWTTITIDGRKFMITIQPSGVKHVHLQECSRTVLLVLEGARYWY